MNVKVFTMNFKVHIVRCLVPEKIDDKTKPEHKRNDAKRNETKQNKTKQIEINRKEQMTTETRTMTEAKADVTTIEAMILSKIA